MKRFLIMILVGLSAQALAQAQVEEATTEAKITPIVPYSTEAFDLTANRLPLSYNGHDPEQIYTRLAATFSGKDEFESTAEYQARIAKSRSEVIAGTLTVNDIFACQVDLSSGKHEIRYDADQKVFRVSLELDLAFIGPNKFLRQDDYPKEILLKKRVQVLEVYKGKTPAGLEQDVIKTQTDFFDLVFTNVQSFPFRRGKFAQVTFDWELPIELPMDATTAKQAKPNLRILLLFRIKEPYFSGRTSHITPTIDRPEDRIHNLHFLFSEVQEIWLYNAETGEIYTKIKPSRLIITPQPVTKSEYERIENGMSYKEVVQVVGVEGTKGQTKLEYYSWENPDGSSMTVFFSKGKVATKRERGLN